MKIDNTILKKVEELARLRLDEDEKKRIFSDLQETLDAFSIIKQADIEDEESSFIPIPLENTLREDVAGKNLGKEKEDVLSLAKNLQDNQIIGPRPIE
jgi:aspartyl-tRNA(Asn)/glutamyl-tRNA(Gln) amidotransferase subunit C